MAITRDDQGRQVYVLEETPDELGMTITAGKVYRFHGRLWLADLTDQTTETVATFQVLDTARESDPLPGPSLWLERDGTLTDQAGAVLGEYHELEWSDGDAGSVIEGTAR